MTVRAWAVCLLITAGDQASKALLLRRFPGLGDGRVVIPRVMDIRHVQNLGAAWGMLQGRQMLLIACAVAALLWLGFNLKRTFLPLRCGWLTWGLLAGGITGNLIDRVWRGFVVDFIDVHCIRFPTFNLADAAISFGVAALILTQGRRERSASTK